MDELALFSIGHSNVPVGQLIERLRRHDIAVVCDVRSKPYSRYSPQFNREAVAESLEAVGFTYRYFGDALGGLGGEPAPGFARGIEQLVALGEQNRVAFMCAEADYHGCHRQRLITPALIERGVSVWHIMGDGSLERGAIAPEQMRLF